MTLEKAIKYKKEKRKPYKGSKAFDSSCRNNKSCSYCRDNRTYQSRKELERTEYELNNISEALQSE